MHIDISSKHYGATVTEHVREGQSQIGLRAALSIWELQSRLRSSSSRIGMPEGSIGKEGPSAGTAILSAFVTLFTGKEINPDTGEFPLN